MTDIDPVLKTLAEYICNDEPLSKESYETAKLCLADSLGCLTLALNFPECTKLLGPFLPNTVVPNGCRVPATQFILDPPLAAFNIGLLIRWLDFNDTWLAAEWGHPSDNFGGILSIAQLKPKMTIHELLTFAIKAYEVQGILALSNCFNRIGFDHVILVKIATAGVATRMLGGSFEQVVNALSQAFIDAGPLRTYRHGCNTGSRKSWAAGDATSRGVFLALLTLKGEMGYPLSLKAKGWGVEATLMQETEITLTRPLGSYVMENILFKVAFPAEFHAQTAVEAAFSLHPKIRHRLNDIEKIEIETHESALRIIDKKGPLHNPADRDHCLQYMVAIALLHGKLEADDYEDQAAIDPRIDALRACMVLKENPAYSRDYLDPEKRSIANSITIYFKDNSFTDTVIVEYPLGHKRRRKEAIGLIYEKLRQNLSRKFSKPRTEKILKAFQEKGFEKISVSELIQLFLEE